MRTAAPGTGEATARCGGFAGARWLGLGVLLAFTVKGIFTTALMIGALWVGIGQMLQPIESMGEAARQNETLAPQPATQAPAPEAREIAGGQDVWAVF